MKWLLFNIFMLFSVLGPGCLPGTEQQTDRWHCGSGSWKAVQTKPGDSWSSCGAGRPCPWCFGHIGAKRNQWRKWLWVAEPAALLLGGMIQGSQLLRFLDQCVFYFRVYDLCRMIICRQRWSMLVYLMAMNTWATLQGWLLLPSLTAVTGKTTSWKMFDCSLLCLAR